MNKLCTIFVEGIIDFFGMFSVEDVWVGTTDYRERTKMRNSSLEKVVAAQF